MTATEFKNKKAEQIARDNDDFRKNMGRTLLISGNHRVVLTRGVYISQDRDLILKAVRSFDNFSEENDPYGEHDFGKITINETNYFFKIDYYLPDGNWYMGADPYCQHCARLLTIMRADEY